MHKNSYKAVLTRTHTHGIVLTLMIYHIIMFMFTAFLIFGKIVAIWALMSGEVASNESNTTMTEQSCAISSNSMSMVELELRCFLSCDEVCDSLR